MSKPRIYVALDALLVPADKPHAAMGVGIAPYAKSFMHWALQQGTVVLLTDGPLANASHVLDKLSLSGQVFISSFEASKVEKLRPDENFYWVDDALIPSEASWLLEHHQQHRLIPVQPHRGVTPETKELLERKLRGQ